MSKGLSTEEPIAASPSAPVRLDDVAAAAGVSTITVSRCISRPARVSRDTRERVLAVAAQMGYIPNRLASSLASSKTRVVGAIVPTIANPIHAQALQAATDVLGGAGYQLLLGDTGYSERREFDLVRTFLGHRVDAMLITGVSHSPECRAVLDRAGIPVVETFEYDPNPIDVNVGFSNREAGAALAVYLIGRGRRRMAFVEHAGIDDSRMRARRNGFLDACAAAGLPGCRLFATAANPATALGGNIVDEIVATMPDVDAVSFAGHQIAAGALRHAVDRGIDVPGRMAIAAFGDSALAQWVRPALTTVRFAMAEMGAEAARLILARLAGAPIAVRTVNLGFEIVVRDSA